jgi:Protein of unknown function (DUF1236)
MKKTMLSTAALALLLGMSTVAAQQSGDRPSAGQARGGGEAQAPTQPFYDAATGRMTQPTQGAENRASGRQDQRQSRQRAQGPDQRQSGARAETTGQAQAQSPREPFYDAANGRMTQPTQGTENRASAQQDQQRSRQRAQGRDRLQSGARAETTGQASQETQRAAQDQRGSARQESASVSLNDQQRTRISSTIGRQDVRPLGNVNFSLSVGAQVPRSVRLHPLSADIVAVAPQFRGHRFFVAQDEIVIVEPSTFRIVAVLPRRTAAVSSTTLAQAPSRVQLTQTQRDSIRTHALRQSARVTTRSTLAVGEPVPSAIELSTFPDTIVTEVPTVRPLRFFVQDRDVVLVDPVESRVVEVIR